MEMLRLLDGLKMGTRQEVGMMSVIPLVSDKDATENHASFDEVSFVGTTNYGSMQFRNQGDKPFILPAGYAVITKQHAQDHGSPYSFLLPPNTFAINSHACCIEETQPGMIDGKSVKDFYLLPLDVRKGSFSNDKRSIGKGARFESYRDFSRLWPIISKFQNRLVKENSAHLVYFFNKFMDRLDKFNAEFETVKGQRGAIILINDEIVGIEIAPTHEYWKVLWKRLVRDCYGSEVVRRSFEDPTVQFEALEKGKVDLSGCDSIEAIEEALYARQTGQSKDMERRVSELLTKGFTWNEDAYNLPSRSCAGIEYHIGRTSEGGTSAYAEVYTEGDTVLYASVLL